MVAEESGEEDDDGDPAFRAYGDHRGGLGVCEYGDGVSLLLGTRWVFFTDWQLIYHASFKPHGHFGGQAADHEG